MKYLKLILVIFLFSCSTFKKQEKYCIKDDNFNIEINSNNLNRVEKKIIFDDIINNSKIKFDKDSNYKIDIKISKTTIDSIITENNESDLQNTIFTVWLEFVDIKNNNKIIKEDRIIISITSDISENRFRNYNIENFIIKNFSFNFVNKLQNKIDLLFENSECAIAKNSKIKK